MFVERRGEARLKLTGRRFSRRIAVRTLGAGIAAPTLGVGGRRFASARETASDTSVAGAKSDFAGVVDIGGRSLYAEWRGEGGPTVVLVSGYRSSGRYWTDDLHDSGAPRKMVLPAVSGFARVVAYDRPGTVASIGDDDFISRSDPVAQPRAAPEVVAELHALLRAAEIPGPFVLVGHSLGGFFARLYASTFPEDVVGLVLVDAYSEQLEDRMTPGQWQALLRLNRGMGTDTVVEIPGYGDLETMPFGSDNAVVRDAVAASPLQPMPLAILAHGKPFALPADAQGFTAEELDEIFRAGNADKLALAPHARLTIATESGHDIHQDQPELVIEAIRQVVEGVRRPDTWYSLESCCASGEE